MVPPVVRNIIIERINSGQLVSETKSGKESKWWLIKHHPDKEIPLHIYLLGDGTIKEIYEKYILKHGFIEWRIFINYTRELIKQNIML
jgi:hypothetical protein